VTPDTPESQPATEIQAWLPGSSYPPQAAPVIPPPPPAYSAMQPAGQGNGLAIAGLVCGILSIPFFWWGIGTLALVSCGLTFGIVGHKRANRRPGFPHKGLAQAGWICAIVGGVGYLCFGIATIGVGFIL
jgi:hypothetical protein